MLLGANKFKIVSRSWWIELLSSWMSLFIPNNFFFFKVCFDDSNMKFLDYHIRNVGCKLH